MMEWDCLLKEEKLSYDRFTEPKEWDKYPISAFEKDYKKIVANAGFRRLQDKTQVFPLDKSDFVRTRLTHSIEVSMIAKQLGTMICTYLLDEKNKDKLPRFPREKSMQHIGEILMCAGLLHDLGNPPFGHFGETVIGDWFQRHFARQDFTFHQAAVSDLLSLQMMGDLAHFEGNAQTLRLVLKAASTDSSDLNLALPIIHTLMKYPTSSLIHHIPATLAKDISSHKSGYFLAEEPFLLDISKRLETRDQDKILRHPLTFLLEAADDIAYATADLEDAFKKGLFTLDEFILFYDSELKRLAQKHAVAPSYKAPELILPLREGISAQRRTKETDSRCFNDWVKFARGWLMYCAAYGFTNNYARIMNGTYPEDLFYGTFHRLSIQALKNAMGRFAYHSEGIVKLELSAQTIIDSLLDKFIPAVIYYEVDGCEGKLSASDKKYLDLISENYKRDYQKAQRNADDAYNLYLRFLMVTDFISGMTDSYAKNLYQELSGIL